mmetsp:Transcript_31671/g.48457  ORF Transcript_31671/g.48457 Transcript_31671/m.48457 type:complete len:95 (-) Transcript_31671:1942-2226(-)
MNISLSEAASSSLTGLAQKLETGPFSMEWPRPEVTVVMGLSNDVFTYADYWWRMGAPFLVWPAKYKFTDSSGFLFNVIDGEKDSPRLFTTFEED